MIRKYLEFITEEKHIKFKDSNGLDTDETIFNNRNSKISFGKEGPIRESQKDTLALLKNNECDSDISWSESSIEGNENIDFSQNITKFEINKNKINDKESKHYIDKLKDEQSVENGYKRLCTDKKEFVESFNCAFVDKIL